MKKFNMIDEMTQNDFRFSRRSVRRLEAVNVFAYYKQALKHEQAAVIPIAIILTILANVLKGRAVGSATSTVYLATYVSAFLCWSLLIVTIFTNIDKAYSWQYLQLKRMTRELLASKTYDEMYATLEAYSGTDFCILTAQSEDAFVDLELTCALVKCKEMLNEYGLRACTVKHNFVRFTIANYFQQRFTLPVLDAASDSFNTVVFTDHGVKLVLEG